MELRRSMPTDPGSNRETLSGSLNPSVPDIAVLLQYEAPDSGRCETGLPYPVSHPIHHCLQIHVIASIVNKTGHSRPVLPVAPQRRLISLDSQQPCLSLDHCFLWYENFFVTRSGESFLHFVVYRMLLYPVYYDPHPRFIDHQVEGIRNPMLRHSDSPVEVRLETWIMRCRLDHGLPGSSVSGTFSFRFVSRLPLKKIPADPTVLENYSPLFFILDSVRSPNQSSSRSFRKRQDFPMRTTGMACSLTRRYTFASLIRRYSATSWTVMMVRLSFAFAVFRGMGCLHLWL